MAYWIVWLIICIAFLTMYSVFLLPLLFHLAAGSADTPSDRALEKFNVKGGISVLYEPDRVTAQYLGRYELHRRSDEGCRPVFVGEWSRPPKSAEFDLSAYNAYGRLLMRKRVQENPRAARFTSSVLLPYETDRVSVVLRRADGVRIRHERRVGKRFPLFLALFALGAALDLAAIVFVALTFFSRIAGGAETPLSAALWSKALILPPLLLAGLIMSFGFLTVYREQVRSRLGCLLRRAEAKLHIFALPRRFQCAWRKRSGLRAARARCAIFNLLSALAQSRFMRSLSGCFHAVKRVFRVRKKRKVANG